MADPLRPEPIEPTASGGADVAALASPGDGEVVDAPARGIDLFFADDGIRRQVLDGFEDIYADIVHYIIRCTHRIWEEGGLGRIYDHYAHNVLLHTADGDVHGVDEIVAGSAQTMAAYPDLKLLGDDVVWSGDGERGFHTSHRITHQGTNLGWSAYGAPTNRTMRRKAVAHCVVKDNLIVEEWVTRDELAAIRAMGLDEFELARTLGAEEAIRRGGPLAGGVGGVIRSLGQRSPDPLGEKPIGMSDAEFFVRGALHDIWNRRRLDRIEEVFAPNIYVETSTNRMLHGHGAYRHRVLEWLAAFGDLGLVVDHTMANERVGGTVVATRWILEGTHDGPSSYGAPTGRRVRTLGFTHHLIQDGRITAEWTVFDEFSILKQIHAPDWSLRPPFRSDAKDLPDTAQDGDATGAGSAQQPESQEVAEEPDWPTEKTE